MLVTPYVIDPVTATVLPRDAFGFGDTLFRDLAEAEWFHFVGVPVVFCKEGQGFRPVEGGNVFTVGPMRAVYRLRD